MLMELDLLATRSRQARKYDRETGRYDDALLPGALAGGQVPGLLCIASGSTRTVSSSHRARSSAATRGPATPGSAAGPTSRASRRNAPGPNTRVAGAPRRGGPTMVCVALCFQSGGVRRGGLVSRADEPRRSASLVGGFLACRGSGKDLPGSNVGTCPLGARRTRVPCRHGSLRPAALLFRFARVQARGGPYVFSAWFSFWSRSRCAGPAFEPSARALSQSRRRA